MNRIASGTLTFPKNRGNELWTRGVRPFQGNTACSIPHPPYILSDLLHWSTIHPRAKRWVHSCLTVQTDKIGLHNKPGTWFTLAQQGGPCVCHGRKPVQWISACNSLGIAWSQPEHVTSLSTEHLVPLTYFDVYNSFLLPHVLATRFPNILLSMDYSPWEGITLADHFSHLP